MTSGWGVDATVDGSGVPTSGTTASDVRKVWGALYTPGIIQGSTVTTSGSSMTYTISSGVVAIKTSTGEIVMAPVQGTTLTVAAPPGTGSRIDVIFAQQRFPADGDSYSIYRVLTFATEAAVSLPANSQEVRRYQINAGPANTSAGIRKGSTTYSIPYAANLGVLHKWQNVFTGPLSASLLREGHGEFYLPTDRRVRLSVTALLYAQGAVGFDNSKYTEHAFLPNIDGADQLIWTTPGLHQAWATYNFEHYVDLQAGKHTTNLGAVRVVGPGTACTFFGTDGSGYGRRGVYYQVEDAGPII